jgi:hypothetical protein
MSLYLGTIGNQVNQYEVHAFTNGLPFGSFSVAEISDVNIYSRMLNERFKSLQAGRTIYCTAVNPDAKRQKEENPHDGRLGTVHVAAIDKRTSKLSCILSVAVDTGDTDSGKPIGLPLENRWRQNGYPEGSLLDTFREKYSILNRGEAGPVKPWEMAELYRHLRVNGDPGDQVSRLGVYTGLYHLLVREPRNRGIEETSVWLFDAIPKYFHLYRLAGAAVLRDPSIENVPRYISPRVCDIEKSAEGDILLYKSEVVSRPVETLKPIPGILSDLSFVREPVPFLDGVIDIHRVENAIRVDPLGVSSIRYEGMSDEDMDILAIAQTVFANRLYEQNHGSDQALVSVYSSRREFVAPVWDFNGVGK